MVSWEETAVLLGFVQTYIVGTYITNQAEVYTMKIVHSAVDTGTNNPLSAGTVQGLNQGLKLLVCKELLLAAKEMESKSR